MSNIDEKYGLFLKAISINDHSEKSLDYVTSHEDEAFIVYYKIANRKRTFMKDKISYHEFPWEVYLEMNVDVYENGNESHDKAWSHYVNYGSKEERSYSYYNNSNLHNGRLGNIFFVNMFLTMMSTKYNLKCNYKYKSNFKKLGISFFKGKKEYSKCLVVTEKNFMYLLKEKIEPANIVITNDVWFQNKEFAQILYNYFRIEKIQSRIIENNYYQNRYRNNNDLFIHIRLGDVKEKMYYLYDYYDKKIASIEYDEAFITSDNLEDPFCQKLIKKYGLRIYLSDEIHTIMFGNTCAKVLMSGGTFSWLLGFFGYYTSDWYYPSIKSKWYGNIFLFKYWKQKLIQTPILKNQTEELNTNTVSKSILTGESVDKDKHIKENINNEEADVNNQTNISSEEKEINIMKKEDEYMMNINLIIRDQDLEKNNHEIYLENMDKNNDFDKEKSSSIPQLDSNNVQLTENNDKFVSPLQNPDVEEKNNPTSAPNNNNIIEAGNDLFENILITKNYDLIDSD